VEEIQMDWFEKLVGLFIIFVLVGTIYVISTSNVDWKAIAPKPIPMEKHIGHFKVVVDGQEYLVFYPCYENGNEKGDGRIFSVVKHDPKVLEKTGAE
jgi:hypothetical protein